MLGSTYHTNHCYCKRTRNVRGRKPKAGYSVPSGCFQLFAVTGRAVILLSGLLELMILRHTPFCDSLSLFIVRQPAQPPQLISATGFSLGPARHAIWSVDLFQRGHFYKTPWFTPAQGKPVHPGLLSRGVGSVPWPAIAVACFHCRYPIKYIHSISHYCCICRYKILLQFMVIRCLASPQLLRCTALQ